MSRSLVQLAMVCIASVMSWISQASEYDVIVRNGTIYDGSGGAAYEADIGVEGDRIAFIGELDGQSAGIEINAEGRAVAPGFFNLLSHAHTSLIDDGRAMSDVLQGVTFEVLSEVSLAPLTNRSRAQFAQSRNLSLEELPWSSVDEYLEYVEASGVSVNFATFVSAATVRVNVLGSDDVAPTPEQLVAMQAQVGSAMTDGALGLTSALIYAPGTFADTAELIALSEVAARHNGIYTAHMRSEGNMLLEAIEETFRIGREAGVPVKIHHLKAGGTPNWPKMEEAISRINAYAAGGGEVTADMYTYTAGATGLDAAMPTWVQAGGYEQWAERLRDPEVRERVKREMAQNAKDWENLGYFAGPEGMLLIGFRNPELQKYQGKTVAEVAKSLGQDPRDTIIDLVIADGSRVDTVYFLMNEDNLKAQIRQPWMMFGSDAQAIAAKGDKLSQAAHPRAYGNVARLLGRYVREERVISLEEAVRRLTLLPATTLGIVERGRLAEGFYADLVVFDAEGVADHATFDQPHVYSTGVDHVLVNGVPVVADGEHTGADAGRAVRGPGYLSPGAKN
ncbi:D-aminoacylase [Congregibacter brevis]|uniref:D-aminoacylase n=1 Tax=Congregibacter brevis TaxID=3081201 RepID=A0ABZ0IA11_9GAMM|nr:D-aminoacylase [Congregibacter sp. IMCC45268]